MHNLRYFFLRNKDISGALEALWGPGSNLGQEGHVVGGWLCVCWKKENLVADIEARL